MRIVSRMVTALSKVYNLGCCLFGNEQKSDSISSVSVNGDSCVLARGANNFIPNSISAINEVISAENTFKEKLADLWGISEDLQALQSTEYVLDWDMSIAMPPKSKDFRAWQLRALDKFKYEKLLSSKVSSMIEELSKDKNQHNLTEIEKALLREIQGKYDWVKKVPLVLMEELIDVTTKGYESWILANEKGDFNIFVPELKKIISIKRQIAEHVGYKDSPYDVFLDEYEPGLTVEKLQKIFSELKAKLIPILKKIDEKQVECNRSFLPFKMSPQYQLELTRRMLEDTGYDFSRSRIDLSEYPGSQGIASNDIRVIVNTKTNIFYLIACALHESGHGRYDMGLPSELAKTPLYDAPSLSMHESQSRMYETLIGHNMPFWKYYFPKLKEKFPEQFASVNLDDFYRAINYVEPPNVRSDDDDELVYNLQMMILCEVEQALIEGKIEVKDVPELCSKLNKDYLDIKNDGVLGTLIHDHWITGTLGYFPTYIIGTLYAAQIYAAAKKANPDLEKQIEKGDFSKLDLWLKENIYKYGKVKSAEEVLRLATGEDLNIDYFINYIKDKYGKLYNVEL